MMPSFLSIALALGFVAAGTSAQSVQPSNATVTPPLSGTNLELRLRSANNNFRAGTYEYTLAPLTVPGGLNATTTELQTWNIEGRLTLVGADNANALTTTETAYISCERNDQFTSSQIVAAAARQNPRAIVLYAKRAVSCSLTGSFDYNSIYSMTNATDAYYIERLLAYAPNGGMIESLITAETTNTSGRGGPNETGAAPTTAVAMSILYSVTGIITLLFLVIICSGALRAHRNPERYGPRRAVGGRTRQSRAKGLAMAMLETIPIVKFGDPEPAKTKAASGRDVELEDGTNTTTTAATTTSTNKDGSTNANKNETGDTTSPVATAGTEVASGMGKAESAKSGNENAVGSDGDVGCSICTEDFTAGEDVRVLPCHHKFHPACVDPWLLNVSGTCPLCRHDLNPTATAEADESTVAATGDSLAPPLAAGVGPETATAPNAGRGRMSRLLDLNRLRHAPPDERIAALRTLREQSRGDGTIIEEPEEPSRRTRMRERFFGGRAQPTVTDSTPAITTTQPTRQT